MPNKKISELSSAGVLTGTESVEIVQGGANVKTTTQDIADLGAGGGGASDWGDLGGTLSDQTDLQAALDEKSDAITTIVDGSTNYTLQASDLTLINAGANLIIEGDGTGTLTIPLNSSVAFPLNCFIGFRGFILVAATGGVTATPTNASLDCDPDFLFALEKTATNTWNVHNGAEAAGGGGGGGTWGSITGTLTDQTDLSTALNAKVDEETFSTLSYGATVTWDTNNRQAPLAKLTATGSFTIDMTNVKSGAQGILKLIKNTASDLVLTFDTSFTNKQLNETLLTYTFIGASGNEYFLSFVVEGTNIEWVIGDVVSNAPVIQVAKASRSTNQAIADNTYTAVSFVTESYDNASIIDIATDATKFNVPGSGDKLVTVTAQIVYAANSTGVRRIRVYVNGADANAEYFVQFPAATSPATTIVRGSFKIIAQGGDYIQVIAYQNSGSSVNLTSAFTTVDIVDL